MVILVEMTGVEFAEWKEEAVPEYAADKIRAGNDIEDGSVERSRKEFDSLLPAGPKTNGHHLLSVVDEKTNRRVGMVWYGDAPGRRTDMLFIYDIRVDKAQRGKGYGTATLRLVEEEAKKLGKKRIGLHVFGHNPGARELYERLGYKATNINMAKDL
jgi:ribosomal protein S18 acetylase RimI-like enzyme